MHEKSGRRERGDRGSESGDGHWGSNCEAEPGRAERKNRRLSSWKRNGSGRKEAEGKWKRPEAKVEGKHLWNGCGSEAGKSERKRTAKPSTGTGKECMRNQAGENGETVEARAETGTGEATVRRNREEKERQNRG